MKWPASIVMIFATAARAAVVESDSARGAALFESLSCVQCHGGKLGRLVDRDFTTAALAATMWNHAPAMWAAMDTKAIRRGNLDEQGAADLFAFFYSTRIFERPGDAARGKRVLERSCGRCHGANSPIERVNAPFELIAAMWNHLPRMQAAAAAKRIALPQLTGQELVDLLVYVRHLPKVRETQAKFETTSGAGGPALFQSKGCEACHETASVLAARLKGRTLSEVAAAMWNHGPAMRFVGVPPAHVEPDEMRELLSYLWAKQFFQDTGDAARGSRVFSAKGCAACHSNAASGAPPLVGAARQFSSASMVSGLWRHGPTMLESMRAQGTKWPRFDGHEMADLIAYLNSKSTMK